MLSRGHDACVLVTPLARDLPHMEADYIGVDAGCDVIEKAGLPLLMAIGDFDSLDHDLPSRMNAVRLPVRKDETDSQSAMQLAREMGYSRIILCGGLSGRLDHTIANLRCIVWQFPEVEIIDEKCRAFVLQAGRHVIETPYRHVSFFAFDDACISLEGFEYPLSHRCVNNREMYTVSNALKEKQGIVTVDYGRVLCVCTDWR